jgi:hypothetical protein
LKKERAVKSSRSKNFAGLILGFILLSARLATAQVTIGNNLQMAMSGSLGAAYSGQFGNQSRSDHALGFGINGILNGFYFSPKFVNFDVRPYFDRGQANADLQSITRSSGVSGTVNFFSNSPYPGSISAGRDYSMNSEFQFVGVPSVSADVTSNNVGVSWSLLLPHKPTLTANWGISNSDASITGTDMTTTNSSRILSVSSTYNWAGWSMFGNISHFNADYNLPQATVGIGENLSNSGTFYSFTTQHSIPIDGNVSLGWSHGTGESSAGEHNSGTSYSVSAGITPWQRLALASSFTYSTNAAQTLAYSALGNNPAVFTAYGNSAKLLFSSSSASIYVGHGLSLIGHVTWREEDFGYAKYTDLQYGGTVAWRYNKRWLEGFYFAVGAVDTANQGGNGGTGLNATVGYDRRIRHWDVSADYNYLHDLQTYYGLVNTSYMNYGGNIHRKLNPNTYLSIFARGSHSGLVVQSGTSNKSSNFGASLAWNGYSLGARYASASGTAVYAAGVLVPTPVAPFLTPSYSYFNGKSLSFNAGKTFFRRLTCSASYTQVQSSTERPGNGYANSGDWWGFNSVYHFRKLTFQGGFTQVNQMFRVTPVVGPPAPTQVVNSFYVSVSRWFNVF